MADVAQEDLTQSAETQPRNPDRLVPIEKIQPNPDQPRRSFDKEALEELAASIREKGVLQPLIVRPSKSDPDGYEIVAGERRWRAAQMARVHDIPVLIRNYSDDEVLEVAIIENVQRSNLNPVDEGAAYRQLMEKFGHTQERLAEVLSKSRSHIANLMRLLQLPEEVLEMLRDGSLSAGHARALITSEDPVRIAREVVAKGMSVRDTERLVRKPKPEDKPKAPKAVAEKDADTRALEGDLSANLGMKVVIDHKAEAGSGKITISYKNLDDLDELCRILTQTSGGIGD